MQVRFIESTHQYLSDKGELCSVSSFVKQFEQKKDWAAIAKKKVNNLKKYQGVIKSVDELLAEWDRKRNLGSAAGTIIHEIKEKETLEKFSNVKHSGFKGESEGKVSFDLSLLEDGYIYPELMCYDFDNMICGQSDEVEIKDKQIIIRDFKGLTLDTEIPTKTGFKLMSDIREGDEIFDGEGNLTVVQHVSDIHYNPCYKITFDTNDTVICDHEHKWEISKWIKKGEVIEKEYTTEELFQLKKQNKPLNIKCTKIKTEEIDLPIDPYVLGVWLGDGGQHSGRITNMNPKLWDELEKRGCILSKDISYGGSGKAQERTIYGFRSKLIKMNLLKNKHIPDMYFRASFEQRLDLLRGFMDTDGFYHKTRKRCVMSTTREWQADALMNLVSSLGWKPTKIRAFGAGFGKKNIPIITVNFNPIDYNPFLTRNEDIIIKETFKSKYRSIKKIEKIETVPTKCISVSSPLKTYLFSRNYIKTHNTDKSIDFRAYQTEWTDPEYLLPPLNHLQNCNGNIYALKMSLYMYMVWKQCKGKYKPGKIILKWCPIERDEDGIPVLYDGVPRIIKEEDIELSYMKKEVIKMLQHGSKNI